MIKKKLYASISAIGNSYQVSKARHCIWLWIFFIVDFSICYGADDLFSVTRPGMAFQSLTIPLNPLDHDGLQVLSARRAVIGNQPGLLQISDLQYTVKERGVDSFRLQARMALYDMREKFLAAANDFRGAGSGLRINGERLSGKPENLVFDVDGYVEVQVRPTAQSAQFFKHAGDEPREWPQFQMNFRHGSVLVKDDPMSMSALVCAYSNGIVEFIKCMDWMAEMEGVADGELYSMVLIAPGGGLVNLRQLDLRLMGRSMLIGPQVVLTSSEGIRFFHETSNGENRFKITGQGDVRSSMKTTESDQIWICSSSFCGVSDRQILQFEGGPMKVFREGMVLRATENWQYVRVLPNCRIVLSPGVWSMVGDLNNQQPN